MEPYAAQTVAVTAGRPADQPDEPLNTPLTPASTYVAGGEREYGRYANPTWEAFEQVLGQLEGGRALSFASGLAAATAIIDGLGTGARLVAPRHAYLGVLSIAEQRARDGRLQVEYVDVADTADVVAASENATLVWLESPTNPMLEVADIEAIATAAKANGALVVVDNTFATPLLQRPLEIGADIVVHSATKALAGHSDAILGAVVTADDTIHAELAHRRSAYGAVPGVFETWLAARGVRTLHVRLERAQANAQRLVERLRTHPGVRRVRYPGFGSMIAIEVAGDSDATDRVTRAGRLWVHATSLGGVESTWERRRRWPTEQQNVPENLIRLSVGIEDVDDLWHDLDSALAQL